MTVLVFFIFQAEPRFNGQNDILQVRIVNKKPTVKDWLDVNRLLASKVRAPVPLVIIYNKRFKLRVV